MCIQCLVLASLSSFYFFCEGARNDHVNQKAVDIFPLKNYNSFYYKIINKLLYCSLGYSHKLSRSFGNGLFEMMAWKICFSAFISMDSHSDWHTLIILHLLGREGGVCQLDKKFRGAAFPLYLFNLFISSKYPTFCYSWLLTLLFCYGLVLYSHWNLLSEKRKKAAVNLFQISSA